MDTIEKTIEALGRVRRQSWTVSILHVCLYAAALLLFFLGGPWPLALALLAGNLLFYLLVVRRYMNRYRREVTAASLRFGLGHALEDFTCRDKGGMGRGDYAAWAMTPILEGENSLMCRNSFSGRWGVLPLAGSELTLHYDVPGGKRDYRFLSGALLTTGTPEPGGWLLMREGLLDPSAQAAFLQDQGYRPCGESPAAGYALYVLGNDAPLPPEALHRVSSLCKQIPSLSLLRLTQTGAAAFLNGRFYTGSRFPAAQLTPERLEANTLPERDELWKFFRLWANPFS